MEEWSTGKKIIL